MLDLQARSVTKLCEGLTAIFLAELFCLLPMLKKIHNTANNQK